MEPFRWPLERYGYPSPVASLQSIAEAQRKDMLALQLFEADIIEKADGTFCIHCDLPGVNPKDQSTPPYNILLNFPRFFLLFAFPLHIRSRRDG